MTRRRRPTPDVIRARLTVAADRLHDSGDKDLAEAVEAILEPRGWELLRKERTSEAEPNMALFMNKAVKEAIHLKANAAGDSLAGMVEEGFRRFIARSFTPVRPLRSSRGSSTEKQNLNVRPSKMLREQVESLCPERSLELGWKVTPGLVATAWLYDEYGITEEDQLGVTVPNLSELDE